LLHEFRFGDAARLGGMAVRSADSCRDARDPSAARHYYEIGARLLFRASMPAEAEDAREQAALTWVTEADMAEAAGSLSSPRIILDRAIQACREIPRCKELLPSLHRRLDAAGAETLKFMKKVSSCQWRRESAHIRRVFIT